jgi:nickel-type superoxide dismutase maturation protease
MWRPALATAAVLAFLFAWARPVAYRVEGMSMAPTLLPGEFLIVVRKGSPLPGKLGLFQSPGRSGHEIVKRVAYSQRDGSVYLLGDNPQASTDSRSLGSLPTSAFVGRVVLRYWPPARVRVFL